MPLPSVNTLDLNENIQASPQLSTIEKLGVEGKDYRADFEVLLFLDYYVPSNCALLAMIISIKQLLFSVWRQSVNVNDFYFGTTTLFILVTIL